MPSTPAQATPEQTTDTTPQRKLIIATPLYKATFDTRGAVATSWILAKNKNTGREIHGASSTKNNSQPLELISKPPPGVAADKLLRPFQIETGDTAVDGLLANRNYRTVGPNSESGEETFDVPT